MGERMIISGGGRLREIVPGHAGERRSVPLEGVGALCAAGGNLYAACGCGIIWRMDSSLLVPTGLFSGGPGICSLMHDREEKCLYALCAEADSLLMLSAEDGMPLIVNRVGVNPCAMAMDESGECIAVAGGASGELLILRAKTLELLARFETGGVVFGAALCGAWAYALSLDETMNTMLHAFGPNGQCLIWRLDGMPGALARGYDGVLAATHRALWHILPGASPHRLCSMPGRAVRLFMLHGALAMTDMWSDTLFVQRGCLHGRWQAAAIGVQDAVIL